MISFQEALHIVTDISVHPNTERISFTDAVNRVLAENIVSDIDMPPFNKSAMDGFACRIEDIHSSLKEIEIIPAGKVPQFSIEKGICSRIMTGAMIPQGADCVIKVEDTERIDSIVTFIGQKTSANICYVGEDIHEGDIVLTKNTRLKPPHVAVLASVGAVNPLVYAQATVAIISTGDELVEPSAFPAPGMIRNSNASQLITQVKNAGAIPEYFGIALDTPESTREKISNAMKQCDIVILTGGVSMGDFDYVPQILLEKEVDIRFKSIAVQPGRPTVFGVTDNCFFYGLPGNPVSSFVQFELLVRPLIAKIEGSTYKPNIISAPMASEYVRKNDKRKGFIPVYFNDEGEVVPVDYHGSAHIHSYVFATGMISVEIGNKILKKGELVDVRQL